MHTNYMNVNFDWSNPIRINNKENCKKLIKNRKKILSLLEKKKLNKDNKLCRFFHDIGLTYEYENDFVNAKKYYNLSIKYSLNINKYYLKSMYYNGFLYAKGKMYDDAFRYFSELSEYRYEDSSWYAARLCFILKKFSLMYHYLFRSAEGDNPYACLFFGEKYSKNLNDSIFLDKIKYRKLKNFAVTAEKLLKDKNDDNHQRSLIVLIRIFMNEGDFDSVLKLRNKLTENNKEKVYKMDKKILGKYFPFFTLIE